MSVYKYLIVDAVAILFSSSSFFFTKEFSYTGYFLIGFSSIEAILLLLRKHRKGLQKNDLYLDTSNRVMTYGLLPISIFIFFYNIS